MTLWLILGAISLAVAAILFVGSRRGTRVPSDAADHDLAVYRAQLDELERDRERGVLQDSELESARLEVQRRMLAADAARGRTVGGQPGTAGWGVPMALAVAVPLSAGAVYLWLGNPGVDSQPFAERRGGSAQSAEGGALPDVATMMMGLRERLAEDPADLQGWITLGSAAFAMGDFGEAITAYNRALAIDADLAQLHSALGEAHIMSAGGIVTEAARRALEQAVAKDPLEPRARFYLAIAREQDGDKEGALAALTSLLEDAPADATWTDGVRQRAMAMAVELGQDPATAVPPSQPAGGGAGPEDAKQLAARLESDPKDYQGWIELARLRMDAGDRDGAQAALQRGAEVYAGAPFVQQELRQAAAQLGLPQELGSPQQDGSPETETAARGPSAEDIAAASEMSPDEQLEMIRGMVGGLAARLEDEPNDAEGWRMLGRSYGVLGEPEKSAEAFGRAAELLPEDMGVQLDYATALLEASGADAPPAAAVSRLEKIVARDPSNPDALYYLGEAAHRQGDAAGAALYWQRLLAQLPEDSEDHAWLKGRLDALATTD